MKTDRIVFGITILTVGAVWLLVNLGVISPLTARELWRYWPLLLVLWGLLLITGKGDGLPGCLVALVILALVFGGIFTVFLPYQRGPANVRHDVSLPRVEGTSEIELNLLHHAGEFRLASHRDYNYLTASFQAVSPPEIRTETSGETAIISISEQAMPLAIDRRLSRWNLTVPEQVPLAVALRTGATRAELNLSRLAVSDLNIKAGAGEVILHLGNTDTNILVESGAGSIIIYVPDDTGVRLRASGGLLSVEGENARVISVGDRRYESRNLEEKEAVADIQIVAGAGSVTLKRAKR